MGQALVTDFDLENPNSEQALDSDSGLSGTVSSDASFQRGQNSQAMIITDLTAPLVQLANVKTVVQKLGGSNSKDKISSQASSFTDNSTEEVRQTKRNSPKPDVSLTNTELSAETKSEGVEEKNNDKIVHKINDDEKSKLKKQEEKEITDEVARTILQVVESVVSKKSVTIVENPIELIRPKSKTKEKSAKELAKQLGKPSTNQKASLTVSSRSNINAKGKQEKLAQATAKKVDAESEMSRLQKQVSAMLSLELNIANKPDDKSESEEEQRVPCSADNHRDEAGHRTRERFCSQCSSRVKLLEEQKKGLSLKLMESEKNVERLVRVLSNLKDILRVVIGEIQANTQSH